MDFKLVSKWISKSCQDHLRTKTKKPRKRDLRTKISALPKSLHRPLRRSNNYVNTKITNNTRGRSFPRCPNRALLCFYGACVTSYGVVDSISELLNVWPEERLLRPLKVKNSTRCGSFHVSEKPT